MPDLTETQIIRSWEINAKAWIEAIHNEEIESRKLVTNQAIIDAIVDYAPSTALDVGCGEGWLARALARRKIDVIGVDVVQTLIDQARILGSGRFEVCSYEKLAAGQFRDQAFDAVSCNFSLLGKESVDHFIHAVPALLTSTGHLFIQTLHPLASVETAPYEEGWRPGSWDGFADTFTKPAPWYFRTIEAWIRLLTRSGLGLVEIREPLHPLTRRPASVLFICGTNPGAEAKN